MSDAPLLVEVVDNVAWLTLNRPETGNAIDLPMARALVEASILCESDTAIRCVAIVGAGRLFCAGGDVALFASAGDQASTFIAELAGTLHHALMRFARAGKPMLVLVNGPAAGAGLGLAIGGDLVLAVRSAHFTAAYGAIGLTPDGGLSWTLPRLVGMRKAQEIILTNRRIMADEAGAIGMITRVVDDSQLLEEGRVAAARLASFATGAFRAARSLLQESFSADYEAHLEREARTIAAAGATTEFREGLAAFFAKRPPDFAGAGPPEPR
jgi:2-(1,2-epoxy-1,2-dihydrophenyl)acetyl-CoA isomerase